MKTGVKLLVILSLLYLFQTCSDGDPDPRPIDETQKTLPAHWADVTLKTIQFTFPNSPTYTSRSLGYIGLTMYESVVHGSDTHKSVASQLNGFTSLPQPDLTKEYNWALSLNAGQSSILKSLYPHAQPDIVAAIDSLESATYNTANGLLPAWKSQNGQFSLARQWPKRSMNGLKQMEDMKGTCIILIRTINFPSGMLIGFLQALDSRHPVFRSIPTGEATVLFFLTMQHCLFPTIIPFSTDPGSGNYKLFNEVYLKRKSLTEEEMRIAAWWADDPTQTASPPGHSYNLATIAVTSDEADIFTAAEAYAKVGMAVADAFICCWKVKYTYHSVRPFPFIKAHIDQHYEQFWPEPPFPAFSSGHATQSAAAAVALTSIFGETFPLVDNTYENRLPDFNNIQYRSRKYQNIQATATECAHSRFLGGIHTRQDNETGGQQGDAIGNNVAGLNWKK